MAMEESEHASRPPSWASYASKRLSALALTALKVSRDPNHMAHRLLAPFASYLLGVSRILSAMQQEGETEEIWLPGSSTRRMDVELKAAEHMIDDYVSKCNLYLLMCCSELMAQLQKCHANLTAIMTSFSQDESWSDFLRPRLADLNQVQDLGFALKLGPKEEMLHDSLEQGMLDSIILDPSLAVKLARQLAECLGLTLESEGFAAEREKLKTDKVHAEIRKGKAHALYLEQFIVLLDKAVAATNNQANREYHTNAVHHPISTRDTLVLPLQSFICPITKDVMRDPVQIASGQSYERSAIERWFEDGHTRCPTGVDLAGNTKINSNHALRQAIAEWRERNNTIRIEKAGEMIVSDDNEQQMKAVQELKELCGEDSLNKYKVASQNIMPALVGLAKSSDLKLRKEAFIILDVLAKDNVENQDIMMKEKIISVTVRCLEGRYEEASECVNLMLTLSGNPAIAAKISKSRSVVSFLVTFLQDERCGENVKAILRNLPVSDENAEIMAEVNIMELLILRLNQGESSSRLLMAKTLAKLRHMPDSSKVLVATEDSMRTLTTMAENGNEEEREVATKAMENLSTVAEARRYLQEDGVLTLLLKILKSFRHSEAARSSSAAVFANILKASDCVLGEQELDEIVPTFLQLLISNTAVAVQVHLLVGLLGLATGPSSFARQRLKDCDAIPRLLKLLSSDDASASSALRCTSLDLLSCLASHFGADAALSVLELPNSIVLITDAVKGERGEPREILAATAFVASLPPENSQICRLLVDAQVVPALIRLLNDRTNEAMVEAAAGALLRFTSPDNIPMQQRLANAGVIQTYVNILRTCGSAGKERAALALSSFSYNSSTLSEPLLKQSKGSMLACLGGGGRRKKRKDTCLVHGGSCSIESTFCLLEAGAVAPLVAVLREEAREAGATAAALTALRTIVETESETTSGEGFKAIEEEQGITVIINLMTNQAPKVQELAAKLCEQLLSLPKYRARYDKQAQTPIFLLAQDANPTLRHLAGRLLRHLDILQSQSSYFGPSIS